MQKRQPKRDYPRTARLNALLQEILAEALERLDDGRLDLVTVTAVNTDADLRRALVLVDTPGGPETDADVLEALVDLRPRLQQAIAEQARLKRTPELRFEVDPVMRQADRIEALLRGLKQEPAS